MHIDLGLKASVAPEQLNNRLLYKPDVFEFFTSEEDFTADGLKRLAAAIEKVKATATDKIVLHHPMRYQNEFTEIIAPQSTFPELYYFIDKSTNDLLQLAFDYDVQVLVHGSYSRHTNNFIALYPNLNSAQQAAFSRLDKFTALGQEHIMFENSISPIFYYGEKQEDRSILARNYRLAFDTSHCFIKQNGSNKDLLASLKRLRSQIVHYHLVDSMGKKHDSLPLGKGNIDWKNVLPLLNPNATSIYEIVLKDQTDATEQLQSHEYLLNLANKLHL
ncbi:TIM barrel protein [Ligilactobacillus sp. WILCCON 0076]|uniref:TIM barrel protein n=1 Tax=Ligilactobacillus ubinensis TaxID=2876789 RepID=A0A9X2FKE3_9LACO|nr:TIM barrel protein [Ligilactobacillus ubinensis]MCP0886133.1 TIM barrel protein [Ligilactobacillus ubinensis]